MTAEPTTYRTAIDKVFRRLGSEAVFTPAAGSPVTCWVMLERETEVEPALESGVVVSARTIEYQIDDLAREAVRGETFTIDGTVYTVSQVASNDGYSVIVVVD